MGNITLERPFLTSPSCQVIQQSLGQQVSMPVAQIVAGFTKVFVGEIVEKGI
jgi:hTAFII28-like protein conserved region